VPHRRLPSASPPEPMSPLVAISRRLAPADRHDRLAWGLFAAVALLVVATFRDYGITWDEEVQNIYGGLVLNYYLSGLKDTACNSFFDLFYYGGGFDLLAAAANRVSPFGEYETRHLLNGLIGVLGLIGTWRLGRLLGGPRAGLLAALLLVSVPYWYGQMFNNPKDIPFAAATVWALGYMAEAAGRLPGVPWRIGMKLGLCIGLALGVRVGGFLLFFYAAAAVGLVALVRAALHRRPGLLLAEGMAGGLRLLLPAVLVAWPVMLLLWPWAQLDPIGNPLYALLRFSAIPHRVPMLFGGEVVLSDRLPLSYVPTHLLLRLPEAMLLALAAALPAAALALRRWLRGEAAGWRDPAAWGRAAVLGLGIGFPIFYVIAIDAVLFDGIRHLTFVLPPLAVLAALALDRLVAALPPGRAPRAAFAALGAAVAVQAGLMMRLHPHQYVYFNSLAGGTGRAELSYELDYWANSYREAVAGLESRLRAEHGERFDRMIFHVAVCGPALSASYYFPANFVLEPAVERADFLVAFTRFNCHLRHGGQEFVRVERADALLSAVVDLRADAVDLARSPRARRPQAVQKRRG